MKPQEFSDEVSAVGKDVTEALKSANVPDAQAKSYSALVQTLVGNMASDAGMSPREIWEQYGIRNIFSEGKDVTRDASGQVQVVNSEAKSALVNPESLHAAWAKQGNATVNTPDEFGPVFSGEDIDFKPASFLAKLRKEKTGAVPNAFRFDREFRNVYN